MVTHDVYCVFFLVIKTWIIHTSIFLHQTGVEQFHLTGWLLRVKCIVSWISILSLVYRIIRIMISLSRWNLFARVLTSELVRIIWLAALWRSVECFWNLTNIFALCKSTWALLLHMVLELFPEDLRGRLGFLGLHVAYILWQEHCILWSIIFLKFSTWRQRVIHTISHALVPLLSYLVVSHKYWILWIHWLTAKRLIFSIGCVVRRISKVVIISLKANWTSLALFSLFY